MILTQLRFFFFFFDAWIMQVVRELRHSRSGVTVTTEDGCVYEANYVILSVSIGVLQSDLIAFSPPLPVRLISSTVSCFILFYFIFLAQPWRLVYIKLT